jgi:hypothetical protein
LIGVAALHLVFPRPGFFLTDVRVTLTLDGQLVHDGTFMSGFDVSVDVPAGRHALTSVIDLGIARRTREWALDVPAGGCDATIAYSRFWSNFSKKLAIVARA